MAVLFVRFDGRVVVIFGLHDGVLTRPEEPLCLAEDFIRNDLLGVIRCLRALNCILQGMQPRQICVG